jgi:hypothetical protein
MFFVLPRGSGHGPFWPNCVGYGAVLATVFVCCIYRTEDLVRFFRNSRRGSPQP